MNYDNFILEFVLLIADVLENEIKVSTLRNSDRSFLERINEYKDIDSVVIGEKTRTEIDIIIFNACNKYIENHIRNSEAFDIGAGIELIDVHYDLSKCYYEKTFSKKIPQLFVNIKDLAKLRLTTIDLAANRNQMLLQRDFLSKSIMKLNSNVKQYRVQVDDIEDSVKSLKEYVKKAEEKRQRYIRILSQ